MTPEQEQSFEAAAKPLIQWLAEHGHPHQAVIVRDTHAHLFTGEYVVRDESFLRG
jgi:hypothetical protein